MDVVILAGGRGTRALPFTRDMPKGMLPLMRRPLVEHVMGIFADQGFTSFVLAIGPRGEEIERHFADVDLGWSIRYSRAGDDAGTGRRLTAAGSATTGTIMATYGDGLADVDLHALLEHHHRAGRSATVTVAPMPSQYGTVDVGPDGLVRAFREKPVLPEVRINAGFFVLEPDVFAGPVGESLETDLLPALAAAGELAAYEHPGFWRSVDTFKDLEELERTASEGRASWAGSKVGGSS